MAHRLGLYRRPGAASQAQESRRQLCQGSWYPVLFRNTHRASRLAPAETCQRMQHTHRALHSRDARCMRNAVTKPPVLGFAGSAMRSSGFPLPPTCTVLGFSVLPQSSVPDRAVAARSTVCRPHGKARKAKSPIGQRPKGQTNGSKTKRTKRSIGQRPTGNMPWGQKAKRPKRCRAAP